MEPSASCRRSARTGMLEKGIRVKTLPGAPDLSQQRQEKPSFSKDKPNFSKDKPGFSKDKPAFAKKRPYSDDAARSETATSSRSASSTRSRLTPPPRPTPTTSRRKTATPGAKKKAKPNAGKDGGFKPEAQGQQRQEPPELSLPQQRRQPKSKSAAIKSRRFFLSAVAAAGRIRLRGSAGRRRRR